MPLFAQSGLIIVGHAPSVGGSTQIRGLLGQACVSKQSLLVLDLQAPLSLTAFPEAAGGCFSSLKQICQLSGELM